MNSSPYFVQQFHRHHKGGGTLVENRRTFSFQQAELNMFETLEEAHDIQLNFRNPVLASMLQGKKVLEMNGKANGDFLPGQSVIMPSAGLMRIHFPEATAQNPTRCLALELEPDFLHSTLQLYEADNTYAEPHFSWYKEITAQGDMLFRHDTRLLDSIGRLVEVYTQQGWSRDALAKVTLQELLIRLMAVRSSELLISNSKQYGTQHRLAHLIETLKQSPEKNFSIEQLAEKACMSKANFFRAFKKETGLSPVDFINKTKLERSLTLLRETDWGLGAIAYDLGYSSTNYYIRIFRRQYGITPVQFRLQRVRI